MQKEELYNILGNHGLLNQQTAVELKKIVEMYPYFQLASILYLKNLKEISDSDYELVLKKIAIQIPNRKQLHRFLNSKVLINSSTFEFDNKKDFSSFNLESQGEINNGNSLIDKFLSSPPENMIRIQEDGNQSQNTENDTFNDSLSEKDIIVTETLAMIYFQQKKYNLALDAFRELSLKYPEKSVYFATRIEEIEKLKNI